MRINGCDSKCGDGDDAGSRTSTSSISSGHGSTISRGTGSSDDQATSAKDWFEPVGPDVTDCPGGVCPVPWATQEEDKPLPSRKAWDVYLEKHQEVFDEQLPVLSDTVNHPSHYSDGEIECIEAIEAQLTPEEYRGYLKGNVAKYVWRERHKGGIESLKKAQWYLNRLINLE